MNDREDELVEIYRAKDSTQAHLMVGALEDAGIRAVVDDDLLQSALPIGWATAPRIRVAPVDADQAREILEKLEKVEESEEE
jgi:hypothetical protein